MCAFAGRREVRIEIASRFAAAAKSLRSHLGDVGHAQVRALRGRGPPAVHVGRRAPADGGRRRARQGLRRRGGRREQQRAEDGGAPERDGGEHARDAPEGEGVRDGRRLEPGDAVQLPGRRGREGRAARELRDPPRGVRRQGAVPRGGPRRRRDQVRVPRDGPVHAAQGARRQRALARLRPAGPLPGVDERRRHVPRVGPRGRHARGGEGGAAERPHRAGLAAAPPRRLAPERRQPRRAARRGGPRARARDVGGAERAPRRALEGGLADLVVRQRPVPRERWPRPPALRVGPLHRRDPRPLQG